MHVTNRETSPSPIALLRFDPPIDFAAARVEIPHEEVLSIHDRFGSWLGIELARPVMPNCGVGVTVVVNGDEQIPKPSSGFLDCRSPGIPRGPGAIGAGVSEFELLAAREATGRDTRMRLMEIDSLLDAPYSLGEYASMWLHIDRNSHRDLLEPHFATLRFPWNPTAIEIQYRRGSIPTLMAWLARRIELRRLYALQHPHAPAIDGNLLVHPRGGEQGLWGAFLYLEGLLWATIQPYKSSLGAQLGPAFVAFGAGKLQMTQRHPLIGAASTPVPFVSRGQPDSPVLFLMPELALAAVQFGIRADWWSRLLPSLIEMVDAFATAYGPTPRRPSAFDCYVRDATTRPSKAPPQPVAPETSPHECAVKFGALLKDLFDAPFDPREEHVRRNRLP